MKQLFVVCMLSGFMLSVADAQVVETANGRIEGIIGAGGVRGGERVFKDVPYAAPSVRDLRCRPPQPAGGADDSAIRVRLDVKPRAIRSCTATGICLWIRP